MKKTITLILAMIMVVSGSAQLRVDTLGRVSIYPLQSTSGYSATIHAAQGGGISIETIDHTPERTGYGLKVDVVTQDTYGAGVYSRVAGYNTSFAFGVRGVSEYSYFSIGTFGGIGYNYNRGAGIYGSSISTPSAPPYGNGIYAGYFYGDVKATGTIYGTLVSPSSVSSPSQGGTTINLSEEATRGETITGKLRQVDLLQMERVNQDGSVAANKVVEKETILDENGEDVSAEEPIQTKLPSISYGLAADQLKEVFPELVYEDKDGNYSINYVEMVPLLVQSIKELSAKVEALEAERDNPKAIKAKSSQMDIADNVNLSIPDKAQKIQLNIYDLSGKLVRTTDVNGSGDVRLSTYTKGLPAGTYAYSLIVDGKKKKARKMIVQHI